MRILSLSRLLPALASLLCATAFAETRTMSVYTDVQADCIEVSKATSRAPIDFLDSECKAFGGYQLHIGGGDLRYEPTLSYQGKTIELASVPSFHELGSNKLEWVYQRTQDQDGNGSIEWKGFIYRLNVDKDGGQGKDSRLFAVRLDKNESCLIGETRSNEEARRLVASSRRGCR